MELILPKLIHTDQTGFISGRYIGQNIRLLSDIMEFSDSKKFQGIFLFVDFEKAFDTLGRGRGQRHRCLDRHKKCHRLSKTSVTLMSRQRTYELRKT